MQLIVFTDPWLWRSTEKLMSRPVPGQPLHPGILASVLGHYLPRQPPAFSTLSVHCHPLQGFWGWPKARKPSQSTPNASKPAYHIIPKAKLASNNMGNKKIHHFLAIHAFSRDVVHSVLTVRLLKPLNRIKWFLGLTLGTKTNHNTCKAKALKTCQKIMSICPCVLFLCFVWCHLISRP